MAIGAFGGALLGVMARLWMRFISEDPEFTWNGTLFIIGGFATFGWSFRTGGGFVAMLGLYAAVVWATRFTLAPMADGWCSLRRV